MSRNDPSLVINNADLTAAVKSGIIDEASATRLTDFVARGSVPLNSDDENLRLITGFNDIFVVIGLGLFLGALFVVAKTYVYFILPLVAWGLAEVFTRRMRMALPSIVLLLVFVASVFGVVWMLVGHPEEASRAWLGDINPGGFVLAAGAAVLAAALHWWRFHVPITFAAGAAALVGTAVGALNVVMPGILDQTSGMVFLPFGLGVFALAMWTDRQDRARRTQLSDRAFWLHLLAAPLIVHPLVWNMTKVAELNLTSALMIVGLFLVLSLVALVVDRRALLVSSLIYLGYALSTIFGKQVFGAEGAGLAVLVVGSVVLLLSVAWKPLRRALVINLPLKIQQQVPLIS
ncbi:MAG: hypothetical protein ABIN69_01730 [Aestuariivirga sp.]